LCPLPGVASALFFFNEEIEYEKVIKFLKMRPLTSGY
jgi:hypothetical protein